MSTESRLAYALGLSTGVALAGAAVSYVLYKGNQRVETFLQSQAIDERNERMHEVRSLIMRIHKTPELSLDRAAPEQPALPEIEDNQPYISDFEMDDERYEAFVEEIKGQPVQSAGPVPFIGDDD